MWNVSFSPDMTTNFIAINGPKIDPLVDSDKNLPVYRNLVSSLKSESASIKSIRATEEQIREDLNVIIN